MTLDWSRLDRSLLVLSQNLSKVSRRKTHISSSQHTRDTTGDSVMRKDSGPISDGFEKNKTPGICIQGFRPNTTARPEQDLLHVGVRCKPNQASSFSQLDPVADDSGHLTLLELMRKEIRPGRSVFSIGESVVNGVFTSCVDSIYVSMNFHFTRKLASDNTNCAVYVYKSNDSTENRCLADAADLPCMYYCSSHWDFITTINAEEQPVRVTIGTREVNALESKKTPGFVSEQYRAPKCRADTLSKASWPPIFQIHQTLINHLKAIHHLNTQTLGLHLAKLAYRQADDNSDCGFLKEFLIRILAVPKDSREKNSHSLEGSMSLGIRLSRLQYENSRSSYIEERLRPQVGHRVYIALGSNVGDRITMLESACREMSRCGIRVVRTGALYETEPMYRLNQQSFLNGVCEAETTFEPLVLLDKLKKIETALGREESVRNGPRSIDLDILLYDNECVDQERLSIPHQKILEREFVLRPLCDLIPNNTLPLPFEARSFRAQLLKLSKSASPLSPLTPLSLNQAPISSLSPTRVTHIMAILNLTPDSFSDGGFHKTEPSLLLPLLNRFLAAGVSIIDIGGQSTRPHAPQITAEDEILRVLPAIKFIRSHPAFDKLAISIDTYRASVADAAISAGANIVNDVSAGQMDHNMLPTIARLGCTVILMHMRGTSETMTTLTEYPSGLLSEVGSELLDRVSAAEKAGIRRWRIILDPGIGFAKNQAQNLELLRRLGELKKSEGLHGLPWVVGASRKSFIGKITGVQKASERSWGTASTVTAAIQGGADIVRVHDAVEMAQVAKIADAIWRIESGSQ